jgi:hypothetical protein
MRPAPVLTFLFVTALALCAEGAVVQRTAYEDMTVDLTFDTQQFAFDSMDQYTLIRAEGMACLPDQGAPSLPWQPVHVAIPYDAQAARVEISRADEVELPGHFGILPIQVPTVLGSVPARWVDGDPEIYASNEFYPREILRGVTQGFMGNNRILSFYVCPLRFNPITGALVLVSEMEVRIELESSTPRRPLRPVKQERDILGDIVRKVVSNPRDVMSFAPDFTPAAATQLEDGYYEYIIITRDSLAAAYAPLVDWKTEKGVPAKCVTREWIEANYSGTVVQEQIKAFIRDAYQEWGSVWFLLGADTGIIPSRVAYAMDADMGISGNKIRADLYYSDLDNDWNDNGSNPCGEIDDNIDMYPDVFVGRAPARNVAHVETFVEKILTYEKNPPADYALKMVMAGEVLWTDPFTDSGINLNMIDEECIPPRFDPILKLYQTMGNESRESVLAAMTEGQNFIIHDGHCFDYIMGAGDGSIYIWDADSLSNAPRNFILNSLGCWPAAIDNDCIAEHFVNNPNGGCVAFVGNCRYGWGSPGNPGFGYSDVFQHEFMRRLFVEEDVHIGLALALGKAYFVPFAGSENVYRYNEYQVNLLGDPEMPVWTDEPLTFDVGLPGYVMAADGGLTVTVSDAHGAVEGAVVCVTNEDDVYLTATSDISGCADFTVSTASPESLLITVSAYNHIPLQARVGVLTSGTHLAWTQCGVADGEDGMANPGETAVLDVAVKNYGTEGAEGVWGHLRSSDPMCAVTDSTAYYGSVGAGQQVGADGFEVELDAGLENSDVVMLELSLTDTASSEWKVDLPLVIAAPVFRVGSYGIDELVGDGDFIIEPGEEILITLQLFNSGLTYATGTATLATSDPYLAVADSVTGAGIIGAGSYGYTLHKLSVSGMCSEPYVGIIAVDMQASDGSDFNDSIYVNVGDLWFMEDCEGGDGNWVRSGSPDLWHLSSYRAHAGTYSWHYGNDSTHFYPNNSDANIKSIALTAGEENTLSFWYWYDFTTYGSDGVYVIIHSGGAADTVEFIGSGGALNNPPEEPLNIYSDWVPWSKPLPNLMPGDSVQVELAFYSDASDYAEGVYLDDIQFRSLTPEKTGVGEIAADGLPERISIFPNPVCDEARILLAPHSAAVALGIYDVEGRLISDLVKPAGACSVSWDLRDSNGRRVAPGIYLAKMKGDAYSTTRKIVVLR